MITEPITLDSAKVYLRVDGDFEDGMIAGLISAAREKAEHYTGRTIALDDGLLVDVVISSETIVPTLPVVSVDSITVDGALIPPSEYTVVISLDGVATVYGLAGGVARIAYTGGYEIAPLSIVQWMLITMASIYDKRSFGDAPKGYVDGLLDRWKVYP